MVDYIQILVTCFPGKQWSIYDNDYSTFQWNEPSPKPTKQELDSLWDQAQNLSAKKLCKEMAKQLLAETDWSVLPDVNLQNKAEFEAYRAQLRALIVTPVSNPVWPTEPSPVWS